MGNFEMREFLDLSDEPSIPVSRLYRIKPPGWDTDDVIALTDYIILEANEHCVPVYVLVEKEVFPTMNLSRGSSLHTTMSRLRRNKQDVVGINGSQSCLRWCKALEQLTLQHDLQRLTFA